MYIWKRNPILMHRHVIAAGGEEKGGLYKTPKQRARGKMDTPQAWVGLVVFFFVICKFMYVRTTERTNG